MGVCTFVLCLNVFAFNLIWDSLVSSEAEFKYAAAFMLVLNWKIPKKYYICAHGNFLQGLYQLCRK